MELLYNSRCLQHDTGYHPERAARLRAIADHFALSDTVVPGDIDHSLQLVHPPGYIAAIRGHIAARTPIDGDTLTSAGTWEAITAAVGLSLLAAQRQDFAIVRPPGHHAYTERASGFCLFNNIAIATRSLTQKGKRVAILDFDGHLGDGTEAIFYQDDQVLYISLHQHPAFPFVDFQGRIGAGAGTGYNVSIPLPAGSGDDIYLHALDRILPVMEAFQPDVVGLSAGFDAHGSDPLLQLNFSTFAYYETGRLLSERFSHIFAVLEGGYNIDVLPYCVASLLAGIHQEKWTENTTPTRSAAGTWQTYERYQATVVEQLRPYWPL